MITAEILKQTIIVNFMKETLKKCFQMMIYQYIEIKAYWLKINYILILGTALYLKVTVPRHKSLSTLYLSR